MKSIHARARFLEIFSTYIGIPIIILSFVYRWTCGTIVDFSANPFGFFSLINTPSLRIPTAALQPLARIFGMLVDGIGVVLLFIATLYFIKILRAFQHNEIFSPRTLFLFTTMNRLIFAWALYNFFESIPLSLATTFLNPIGKRALVFEFTSGNLIDIFIIGCFLVISSMMREGARLKQEQDLTV
jgi:hypothetical protein